MKFATSETNGSPESEKSPTGLGIVRESGAIHSTDTWLYHLTRPWGSPEAWWGRISAGFAYPATTRCPQCGLGQRLGWREHAIELPNSTEEALFSIEFVGHPHALSPTMTGDLILVRDVTEERSRNRAFSERLEQFHSICDHMEDVYYRMDANGVLQFVSPSVQKLLKHRPSEIQGRPLAHFCANPEHLHEMMQILKSSDRVEDFDLVLLCRRGKQAPVSITAHVIRNEDGRLVAVQGIFRDVVERTRMDAVLADRTRQFQEMITQLDYQKRAMDEQFLMSIADPYGTITRVNDRLIQVSQYSREEILGNNHTLFDSGYHPKSFFKEMWRLLQSGRVWHGEIRNRKKNGDFFWVDCTIVPFLTPMGRPFQYITVGSEITSRVATEERLEGNLAFFRRVMDAMGDGLYVLDKKGQVQAINREAERLLGLQEADILHKNLHEIIHYRRPDGTPFPIRECPAHQSLLGRSYRVEEDYFIRKDGTLLPVAYVTTPIMEDTEIIGSMAVFRDATMALDEVRKLKMSRDTAQDSSRMKSAFLANMSHEIRTPMNAIVGMNDLLMDTPLNEEQLEFAQIVKESSRSLLALINDILDFSKIEAGKIDIERIDFSLLTVVEGAAELLAPQAHDKGISLMTHVSSKIPVALKGDPGRLRQMLLNLLGNAIKFTEDGEVTLRAILEENVRDRVVVHFSVADTGIGLAAEEVESKRLFEPFTQAERGTARKFGGTGLGLAISKRLAELMGGEIGAQCRPQGGTVFWFRIPFQTSRLPVEEDDSQSIDQLKGLRVLSVLENPTDREILHDGFTSWNMTHHGVLNGDQGLIAYREAAASGNGYQVAVIAASLADMDCQIMAELLRREPGGRTLNLIALMDWEDKEERAQFLKAGFTATLVKPVRRAEWIRLLAAEQRVAEPMLPGMEMIAAPATGKDPPTPVPDPDAYDALESGNLLLLVEDNPVNQKVALLQLKKLGYAVHAVSNGQEAVEAVNHLPYALILMDCQMPVMDGFEATHAIRKSEQAASRHIPIIAMTAHAMKGDRERCLAAGMDDYLSKPVAPELLLQKLQHWIPKSIGPPPPVEIHQLRQLFGEDDDLIRELLLHFQPSARELLDKLADMIQKEQVDPMLEAALELKEACSNMGVSAMARLAQVMEEAALRKEWSEARRTSERLETAFRQVEKFIETF
ncbi:MAG: PAS domain S-box protein [Magnetococcales bacterium]|nr:PAS domain S-box protein [Magnetococcales bacterium]